MILALGPLLLVAEQGRTWGWGSAASISCYVIGALGIAAFIVVESLMKDDAIIPLKVFRSGTFSMATVIGFLVGFAMFGAMLTLPLYVQIVLGLDPTQSGFATLPLVGGLMIASIASGQIVARTGKYRIFPVLGTAFTTIGYIVLTFMTIDKPLWFLFIAMFLIGLGLGQLMQSLTLASQASVGPRDMGVATSAATFFRQMGGTLGTAVLLSILFAALPTNIAGAMGNKADLTSALDAALTPSVAGAPENAGAMKAIWSPIVTPVREQIQTGLDTGTQQATAAADQAVTQQVTAAVQQQVDAGAIPAAAAATIIGQQVAAARPQAEQQALAAAADQAHASVIDGKLAVDWTDAAQRGYWVGQVEPKIADKITGSAGSSASSSSGSISDTSFLNGADQRLTRPFLTGFNTSTVMVFWVGFAVILLAFLLSLFFKVPPLRQRSALQEQADDHAAASAQLESEAGLAAAEAGSFTGPISEGAPEPARRR
ncbi:hypothetical protein GCM10025866_04370 [Naasia aerilata]|uniref:MFS transporter n=1 Tax=Naasia aerilata TaxID=1162966 RepID=A0ABN6XMA4_9MICO|nr:MFS transporter [Naasia aerilata]BDZ44528.1 hypothetical protein GCM10025866_04370 [Naasia aerilata]